MLVVEGDEKGTRCLGVQLGHPLTGGYKYRDLAQQKKKKTTKKLVRKPKTWKLDGLIPGNGQGRLWLKEGEGRFCE
jgi:hypothetical protein